MPRRESWPAPRVLLVTGTDTGVGKTVVSAALAAALHSRKRRVAVYKPVQTGVRPGEPGDMEEVARLAAVHTHEGARLVAPMAPRAVAELECVELPTLDDHAEAVAGLLDGHDVVVVEGSGGLLVELTDAGEDLASLAECLPDSATVVAARSGLGTLNHTFLTLEALSRRGLWTLGTVLGAWPEQPDAIAVSNRRRLEDAPGGLVGVVPERAPRTPTVDFRREATTWLGDVTRLWDPVPAGVSCGEGPT
ncbi:dethiobiotin synthase [Aeromicrobium sp. CTD01-1L150]|uniref:dethiobiotin synthase n=1 Tax=Aeromicrobium sp. CTD01-1L150 TaxID=3341830 RepID=UPI0035C04374